MALKDRFWQGEKRRSPGGQPVSPRSSGALRINAIRFFWRDDVPFSLMETKPILQPTIMACPGQARDEAVESCGHSRERYVFAQARIVYKRRRLPSVGTFRPLPTTTAVVVRQGTGGQHQSRQNHRHHLCGFSHLTSVHHRCGGKRRLFLLFTPSLSWQTIVVS